MHSSLELIHLTFLFAYNHITSHCLLSTLVLQLAASFQLLFSSITRFTSHFVYLCAFHAVEFFISHLKMPHLQLEIHDAHRSLLHFIFLYTSPQLSRNDVDTLQFLLAVLPLSHIIVKYLFLSLPAQYIHAQAQPASRLDRISLQLFNPLLVFRMELLTLHTNLGQKNLS